ncbi:MAG: SRPBCC family protein [Ornithinimicrobium sp.]|uniref:SRPBCC family protein n=1 Tax=Ornithinimicrobium sp. TaxID=1977084 RepID=UPI00184F0C00|nr:SRPBCC family protein [Actinomycetota bacterium]
MSNDEQIVSERITIEAPARVVFDIVADPHQHSRIDGSGSVKGMTVGPERLSQGARFGARMKLFGLPYRITNRVVEFEEDRRIAWRHFGGHRWRYELEPLGEAQTGVTESFDYSRYTGLSARTIRVARFPARNRRGIQETLVNLKAAAERDAS